LWTPRKTKTLVVQQEKSLRKVPEHVGYGGKHLRQGKHARGFGEHAVQKGRGRHLEVTAMYLSAGKTTRVKKRKGGGQLHRGLSKGKSAPTKKTEGKGKDNIDFLVSGQKGTQVSRSWDEKSKTPA